MVQSRQGTVKSDHCYMSNAWDRLEESLYFYIRHGRGLATVLLPVAVPAFLLKHFRAWWALGWDSGLIQQDGLLTMLELLVGLFAGATTLVYAARVVRGENPAANAVRREAVMVLPLLFLTQMLVFFAALGGFMLLIVPGLWIMACLMPAYVYVVADKRPVMRALQESFRTFRPVAWLLLRTLALAALLLAPVVLFGMTLTLLLPGLPSPVRMVGGAAVDTALLFATQLIPVVLVRFYDLQQQAAIEAQGPGDAYRP